MKEVFQRLYSNYHHDLFNFLFYMVKNREYAEDLVQEVYIKVLKSYDRFEGKSSEKTWLFSIARHVAIDWFRKNKKEQQVGAFDEMLEQITKDDRPLPEEIAVQQDEIKILYKCLNSCSDDQRLVLTLRFIQAFSIKETADILGWTESKVKTTQHRGMKALKEIMDAAMKEGMADAQRL